MHRTFTLRNQLPNLLWVTVWAFVIMAFILPWMIPNNGG